MNCIITIEMGTNAVRIFAFKIDGTLIGSSKGHYPTFHDEQDYSEQDPEQMFITMLFVLKNLLTEKIHPQKYRVDSICFSASMHSLLAVDKNGVPIGNAITWADNRGKKEATELKNSALGKEIYSLTGTPIHPMSPLVKIAWIRNNLPERFKKTWKFLSIKSYIIQQLTGVYVLDQSLASATGLFNIHNLQWEQKSLDYAGITSDKLPSLCEVFFSDLKLRKEYLNTLKLDRSTEIIVGSSDGCMATLGAGIWDGNKATITIEDSGAMRVVSDKPIHDDKLRLFNYVLTKQHIISGGPTNNGGLIFDWFNSQFGDSKTGFNTDLSAEGLIEEASDVPAGSNGALFLPYLLGERAPIWDANARGVYFGLNIRHQRKHLIRATIEGILYGMYNIGQSMETHRTIDSLSLNGSFATIPFCAQMISDIFNKPVGIISERNSVGKGAFLLSAINMGIYKDIDEAARSVTLPVDYKPNKQNHKTYNQYFKVFERLSVKLAEEFEAISNLQQENES